MVLIFKLKYEMFLVRECFELESGRAFLRIRFSLKKFFISEVFLFRGIILEFWGR